MKQINVKGLEDYYTIDESGMIYSLLRKRFLKHQINNAGYSYVFLKSSINKSKWYFVHRLVAVTFLGDIPEGHEVNHKDGNKQNNDGFNLEYVTHKDNIIHSFKSFRRSGRLKGFLHSDTTKNLMAESKLKPIKALNSASGHTITFQSVEALTIHFNISRRTYNRNTSGYKGYIFTVL